MALPILNDTPKYEMTIPSTNQTLKFRPYVMAGRVFKEEESLTLWVSADDNKIPLKIKADLAVGSLRADLVQYKGLKHSFEVDFD